MNRDEFNFAINTVNATLRGMDLPSYTNLVVALREAEKVIGVLRAHFPGDIYRDEADRALRARTLDQFGGKLQILLQKTSNAAYDDLEETPIERLARGLFAELARTGEIRQGHAVLVRRDDCFEIYDSGNVMRKHQLGLDSSELRLATHLLGFKENTTFKG